MARFVSVTTPLAEIGVGETVLCGRYSIQRTTKRFMVTRGTHTIPVPETATTVGDACQAFGRAVSRMSLGNVPKATG